MDINQLKAQIKSIGKQISDENIVSKITDEEKTKNAFVMPFFAALGWNVFNPLEFVPEYTADVGIKKGEKVDYAIMIDNQPQVIIECKSITENLDKHDSQLFRYFATSDVKFGILTNGREYRFYTDLEKNNVMDSTPFLTFDISKIRENQFPEIAKFHKDNFDIKNIISSASELKYVYSFKEFLSTNIENPSDDFIKCALSEIYEGAKTQKIIDSFKDIIKNGFQQFISEKVNEKLNTALVNADSQIKDSEDKIDKSSKKPELVIDTTEDELEVYSVVKFLSKDIIDPSRIFYRDTKSDYFNVLIDGNINKWILRYYQTRNKKSISIREGESFEIQNAMDIEKYFEDKIKPVIIKYSK